MTENRRQMTDGRGYKTKFQVSGVSDEEVRREESKVSGRR
jgi:hypothetical protein